MNTASLNESVDQLSPVLILSKKQLAVLSSGPRTELLMALRIQNSSAADLARITGRTQTSLYYHLQQLLDAELIRVKEVRMGTRRDELVYEAVADFFQHDSSETDPEYLAQCGDYLASVLKVVERHYRHSLKSMVGSLGEEGGLFFESFNGWLTDDHVASLRRKVRDAVLDAKEVQDPQGRQYTFAAVMTPVKQPRKKPKNS